MQTGLESAAVLIESGEDRNAAVAVGGVRLCQSLWGLLHPPAKPEPEAEEQFVDPALR